ncbi:putative 2OG-Fe(II) oxygenase [Sphingomonas arenae]|uniref:putative 2OG-Fe(II) oxygenase n=1 Tax=Sphingomonas arenae TaxID=2812555 RepID=UPI001966ED25|nr:putative 2OG-Fe(II) oxygenase [Sphingomonas arenae]
MATLANRPTDRSSASAAPEEGGRRLDLFPVPVFIWKWNEAEQRKSQLLETIRHRRASEPGIVRTNRDGWHSDTDLPAWEEPGFLELVRWATACVRQSSLIWSGDAVANSELLGSWRLNGWANVNPPGGHNISHTHAQRNWNWSACYYVDLPDIAREEVGGALVLEERGTGLRPKGGQPSRTFRHIPAEGEIIIFPATLFHSVEPHNGPGDRVSIALNFHHPALELARLWEHRPRIWWRKFPKLMRRVAQLRGSQDWSAGAAPHGYDVVPLEASAEA